MIVRRGVVDSVIASIVLFGGCASALHELPAAGPGERTEALIVAAREGVRRTEHDPDASARERAAVEAVRASQRCVEGAPGSARCAYWLGASLGVQARARPTTARSALPILIESFARAAAIDPLVEDAGPDRALALVYLRAPGWPAGPGDADRGLTHARRAVALRPEYPPNLLVLAEALAATEEGASAREEALRARELARLAERAGDRDATDWLRDAERLLARLPED